MKQSRGIFVVVVALLTLGAPVAAQVLSSPLQSGTYVCNGTDFRLSLSPLGKGGMATLYRGGAIVSNATITTTDASLALTFITGDAYKGKTWIYAIDTATSFSGNGELWMRVGGTFTAPPVAPGGITAPAPDDEPVFKLKTGTYGLSGSRRQLILVISGTTAHGHFRDDAGKPVGNITARIDGNHLAVTITSGKDAGITYDYQITGTTSFAGHRENWVWRYEHY
jgi:hypothetical protein